MVVVKTCSAVEARSLPIRRAHIYTSDRSRHRLEESLKVGR
jgi:hypothetical protein